MIGDPGHMLFMRFDEDPSPHHSMADSANFRALNRILTGPRGLPPTGDHTSGDRILLEPKNRHRETVHHIGRRELVVVDLVYLYVQLIDLGNVVGGIELAMLAFIDKGLGPLLPHP